jgi:hypothetical protein
MAHVLLQESLNHGHVMLLGDAGDDRKRELELIQGRIADIRHHQAKGFGIAGGQGARRSVWPVTGRLNRTTVT